MMGVLADMIVNGENRNRTRTEQMTIKRILRDVLNPFTIGDRIFHEHYRMYPDVALELIGLLQPYLPHHEFGIRERSQVLGCLRFLAEGQYQKATGRDMYHPMSQSSVSRYLHHVIYAINQIARQHIRFPSTAQERNDIQAKFQQRIGFPGVLGAVDCTLPKIIAPHEHEEAFFNYKRQHSLTLQIVADTDYIILGTRICSGSTNDRFVWRWSLFRERMYRLRPNENVAQAENHPFYVIGDGGYSPSPILLTPVAHALPGTAAYRYSAALREARVIVENVFGILKGKWRCLSKLKGLHNDPIFAAQIVQACTVLHNFLRRHGMPVADILNNLNNDAADDIPQPDFDHENDDENDPQEYVLGLAEREVIIQTYFNNVPPHA